MMNCSDSDCVIIVTDHSGIDYSARDETERR